MSANHYRLERAASHYLANRARYLELRAIRRAIGTGTSWRAWRSFRDARHQLEELLVEHGRPFEFRGQTLQVDRGGFLESSTEAVP